jgi:hypothetical protein
LQAALHDPVDDERDEHRGEQNQADDGAFVEVLLADHLLEDIERQHVEVAADHFGDAEVADRVGKDDHRGAHETVLRARQRDREELSPRRSTQRLRRFVEPPVRQQQRGQHDHQRVRKSRVDGAQDDADGAVHARAAQQSLEQALRAEPLNERNRAQQRRREDRRQRDHPKESAPRHARARQRIRIGERKRNGDAGDSDGDPQGVRDRLAQRRCLEILLKLEQTDERAILVLHALHEDHEKRREQKQCKRDAAADEQALREPLLPMMNAPNGGQRTRQRRGGGRHSLFDQPRIRSAADGRQTDTAAPGRNCACVTVWRGTLTTSGGTPGASSATPTMQNAPRNSIFATVA